MTCWDFPCLFICPALFDVCLIESHGISHTECGSQGKDLIFMLSLTDDSS